MVLWLILGGFVWYGLRLFRGAVQPVIRADHDVVGEAERLLEGTVRHAWIRPVASTAITWAAVSALLTPIDIGLAIWVGGAVIAVGAMATFRSCPDPTRIDDEAFDRELRNLFEQHS